MELEGDEIKLENILKSKEQEFVWVPKCFISFSMKAAELHPLLYSSLRSTIEAEVLASIKTYVQRETLKILSICTGHSKLKKKTIGRAIIELYLCLRACFPICQRAWLASLQ